MEGLSQTIEQEKILDRAEKIKEAEIRVREMFDASMEARGTIIERIKENPNFRGLEERDF